MITRAPLSRRILASLAAGLVAAAGSYLILVLAFFIALSAETAQLGTLITFFLGPALVLIVLVGVVFFIEIAPTWYRLFIAAIIASLFSAYIGTFIYALALGDTSAAAGSDTWAALSSTDLAFMVVAVLVTMWFSRRVYWWVVSYARGVETVEVHRTALVREPAATLAEGQVTYVERMVVDAGKAEAQWEEYLAALSAEGFDVVELLAADQFPDSVFIEDTVVMLGQTAVIASPGAESRRGEQDAVEAAVTELGLAVEHIRLPGTLEGGDVLKVGDTLYVGRGGRTNAEGIRQLRAIAGDRGYRVVAVPVTKALHLKSTVTALPDGTVIGHPSVVDHPELFERYLEVPEVAGVAVVVLSPGALLISASAPKTAALLDDLGYRVVAVDISEFEKLEGCVTCLSVRIR